ncbi:MAG: TIGR04282 family arsenosugar biosynthesis glycosyltransferase [Planctomycetaceae bacterium]|nr:TIGR04282 family arsenosugar biosynthesis glycosyltransferase [Planctomycetaceae bacterium]
MTASPHERAQTLLGVFAKHWEPGKVKTRLAQSIGESHAATLHALFVGTLIERFSQAGQRRMVAFWPPEAQGCFAGVVRDRWELVAQTSGDLGQRMQAFFVAALARAERIVVIGSDSPDLPVDMVQQAFDALANHDVVLGPAADGGYYLLGITRRIPPIFKGIAWSSCDVWSQTTARLKAAGIAWHSLPAWYDVDEPADLAALRQRLPAAAASDPPLARLAGDIASLLHKAGKK